MEFPASIFIAIGAVLAAIVAGFFSFLNLVSSKENKVSEFRQGWINSIRDEISEFTAATQELARLAQNCDKGTASSAGYYEISASAYYKASKSLTNIQLRLNPMHVKENPSSHETKLLTALMNSRKLFNDGDYDKAIESVDDIRNAAAPFLKDEWERVKDGEPRYQAIRDNASRTITGGIILLVLIALYSLIVPWLN